MTTEAAPKLGYSTMDVLKFIVAFSDRHHVTPTLREIMAGMGYASTSVANYHVARLIAAEYLARPAPRSPRLAILKRA